MCTGEQKFCALGSKSLDQKSFTFSLLKKCNHGTFNAILWDTWKQIRNCIILESCCSECCFFRWHAFILCHLAIRDFYHFSWTEEYFVVCEKSQLVISLRAINSHTGHEICCCAGLGCDHWDSSAGRADRLFVILQYLQPPVEKRDELLQMIKDIYTKQLERAASGDNTRPSDVKLISAESIALPALNVKNWKTSVVLYVSPATLRWTYHEQLTPKAQRRLVCVLSFLTIFLSVL